MSMRYFYHLELSDGIPLLVKEEGKYTADGRIRYNNPQSIYDLAVSIHLDRMAEEYVYLACMNTAGNLLGFFEISHGGVNYSPVSPREVYQRALMIGATQIILMHNHPSGDPCPSATDIKVTKQIKEAGEIIGIRLTDHIVIGNNDYISMMEKDLL